MRVARPIRRTGRRNSSSERQQGAPARPYYSALRAERERLCVLVVIGVNARGEKHFLAIEDGRVRESTQSWREVLLEMNQRGFTRPAKLAVGDEPLGSRVGPANK